MYTGIIEEVGRVQEAAVGRLVISAKKTLDGTKVGDSLAINGVCLTAIHLADQSFTAEVMPETLRRSNLGELRRGDDVNLERPLALSDRLGGHLVQGHVDGVGRLLSAVREGPASIMTFEAPDEILRYIVIRGFIAVDGVSLTVTRFDTHSFAVSIAAFTLEHTNLGHKRTGDPVNLEADIIAKYVERLTASPQPGITAEFLAEHGFPAG